MESSKKRIIYTIAVTFIIVFSTSFAILMTLERMDYRNYLQGEYSKNMYDLINSVDNIRTSLSKAPVAGDKDQSIIIFENIFRYASSASDKLASLPVAPEITGNTNKYLSQVGDFSNSLATRISEGNTLSSKELETINTLKKQSIDLENDLNNVMNDINQGKVKWGEIRKKASTVFASTSLTGVSQRFQEIEKQVADYPALVYDGPFSDNVQDIKPKVLNDKEVSAGDAEKVVRSAVGDQRIASINRNKDTKRTKVDAFSFTVSIKGNSKQKINCEVSKNGGKIIYLLDNRQLGKPILDEKKALDIGSKFLNNLGYKNMNPIYTLKYDGEEVISYAYTQDKMLMYPDQMKLKIALDDGSIIGIESEKYLVSHVDTRSIPAAKVSLQEASSKVSKNLNIKRTTLCVIPTVNNSEALCYEFFGTYDGDSFFVYIDAVTGYEKRILQIINTPNGQLSM